MDSLIGVIDELKISISNIKPVVIVEGNCYTKHILESKIKPIKKQLIVNKIKPKIIELDVSKWIIVPPGTLKTGYINNVNYKIQGGHIFSDKLFWLINGDKREVIIAKPKKGINTEEYYRAAKLEAKEFIGVDL
jgi:hypothetical protein